MHITNNDLGVSCKDGGVLYPAGVIAIIMTRDNLPTEEKVFPYNVLISPEQKLLCDINQKSVVEPVQESTFIIISAGPGQPLILQLAGTRQLPWSHEDALEKN